MRVLATAILTLLLFGAVAAGAYQAGIAAAGAGPAGAAAAASPYYWHPGFFFPFGFLFPLLLVFVTFGLVRAAFGHPRAGGGYGRYWGRPQMFDEWHRELHEREKTGPEKAER